MVQFPVVRMLKLFLQIGVFLLAATAAAQETYQFTKGLIVPVSYQYGREAIYTDPLAYQLHTDNLKKPVEGTAFATDDSGQTVIWQAVVADSANRLYKRGLRRGGFGRGGYVYLTYTADAARTALLNITGNSSVYVNGELHAGDPYNSGWLYIPVPLKKGLNEFYVRGAFISAKLIFPAKNVLLNTEDPTLPSIILNEDNNNLQGAVVVINTTSKEVKGLQLKSNLMGKEAISDLPAIPPFSCRKVPFTFNGTAATAVGKVACNLELTAAGKRLDTASVAVDVAGPADKYSTTFISGIDGSLQYYAVAPQASKATDSAALFLSVHGAGVEAIGQARAYNSKDWGTLVAATNRRPRGFNWEDWGRLDALEVLQLAKEKFKPHPQRIYLTGHSMGGHGTWFLGATYPDKWAAIAPCAGYPTLKGYGSADGLVPDSSSSSLEQMLLRAGNQSDVPKLASNYKPLGVYIFHGDSDRVVSVNYARQMRKLLADFHTDLSYYEYPGGSHWFGNHSVDWGPIFDFFSWHSRPVDTAVNTIDFITASPGISPSYRWASIEQQFAPLQYSRLQLKRNRAAKTITGTTENVRLLKLNLKDFGLNATLKITMDDSVAIAYTTTSAHDSLFFLKEGGAWKTFSKPHAYAKGPHRYGTLKDAFNHHMVFVYGTAGTKEENAWSFSKARYDAETWYYRGNGAVDIIADTDFSLTKYKDRGVILYGNKSTTKVWKTLLNDCPIQMERNKITAGKSVWQGDDLSAYFVWPIRSSAVASVAVVGGTGMKGMQGATANQYFAGASGFPDFMVYRLGMLQRGVDDVKLAGFFDNDWKLNGAGLVVTD